MNTATALRPKTQEEGAGGGGKIFVEGPYDPRSFPDFQNFP